MDGQVRVFNRADAVDELTPDWHRWKPIDDSSDTELLTIYRGRLAMVARRIGGSYMYKASLRDDKLYFVYGQRTCLIKWCNELNVNNTGRCGDHQKDQ